MRTFGLLPLCAFIIPGALAQPTCGNVQLTLSPDYSFAIGSSNGGSTYHCPRQDRPVARLAENTGFGWAPADYLGRGLRVEVSLPVQVIPKAG